MDKWVRTCIMELRLPQSITGFAKKRKKNGIVILGLVTSTFVINTYIYWSVFPVLAVGMGKIDTVTRY
tara:strand:+ start:388 stop:591 length:204 start_codon:yes stop_codon:yes gene_type:complete